jgi:hypothetical protein
MSQNQQFKNVIKKKVERVSFIELRFDDLQKHVVNLTKNTTKEQERMLANICELESSNKGLSKSNESCKKECWPIYVNLNFLTKV